MAIRVLVVDDSGFFRRRVSEMLNADPLLEVVDTAENGEQAVQKAAEVKPDVITMDIEMPVMNGIDATRKIMAASPTPIIMFSSLTTEGAQATLDALEAGALDFLPKRFEDISKDKEEARHLLCNRVRSVARKPVTRATAAKPSSLTAQPAPAVSKPAIKTVAASTGAIKLVAIGTSTGGPVALQNVLTKIPANFPVPIVMVQHMPGTFTPAFAQRLNAQCAINVKEAEDGEALQAGTAYLAPGGKQMLVDGRPGNAVIRIKDADASQTYKPSVDITFASITRIYPAETLAIILTGMGADGREGSRMLKEKGSSIWAQDEASSVVYGMPAAVAEAGLVEKVLPLNDVGTEIVKRV